MSLYFYLCVALLCAARFTLPGHSPALLRLSIYARWYLLMPPHRFFALFYGLMLAAMLLTPSMPTPAPAATFAGDPAPPTSAPLPRPSASLNLPPAPLMRDSGDPDRTDFDTALRLLPIRFQSAANVWTVHEYGDPTWHGAVRAFGCDDQPDVEGWTLTDERVILIRQHQDASPVAIFWHEIGHALIYPRLTKEERGQWNMIYASDYARCRSTTPYARSGKEEAFCEGLRLYQTDRAGLDDFTAQRLYFHVLMGN